MDSPWGKESAVEQFENLPLINITAKSKHKQNCWIRCAGFCFEEKRLGTDFTAEKIALPCPSTKPPEFQHRRHLILVARRAGYYCSAFSFFGHVYFMVEYFPDFCWKLWLFNTFRCLYGWAFSSSLVQRTFQGKKNNKNVLDKSCLQYMCPTASCRFAAA